MGDQGRGISWRRVYTSLFSWWPTPITRTIFPFWHWTFTKVSLNWGGYPWRSHLRWLWSHRGHTTGIANFPSCIAFRVPLTMRSFDGKDRLVKEDCYSNSKAFHNVQCI